ncbi:hypothetical protein MAR_026018, partial [Mya arenaria]
MSGTMYMLCTIGLKLTDVYIVNIPSQYPISFDITLQDSDVRRLVMSQILTWLEHAKCTGISAVLLHHLTDEHEWPPPIQYYELNRAWNNRRGWQYSPVNAVKEKRPIHTESLKKLIFTCHLTNNFS